MDIKVNAIFQFFTFFQKPHGLCLILEFPEFLFNPSPFTFFHVYLVNPILSWRILNDFFAVEDYENSWLHHVSDLTLFSIFYLAVLRPT